VKADLKTRDACSSPPLRAANQKWIVSD